METSSAADPAILTEAFRRAQIGGRLFPVLCDFPPFVSADEVERVYLPALYRDGAARGAMVEVSPIRVTTETTAERSHEAPLLTYAGDGVAAAHPLAERLLLSAAPHLS